MRVTPEIRTEMYSCENQFRPTWKNSFVIDSHDNYNMNAQ